MTMKTCFKCGVEKDLSEFYVHKQMADGHLNKCKTCTINDANAHRWSNINKIREYDRARKCGERREKGYYHKRKMQFPEKYAATLAINAIRRRKDFVRPTACEICGCEHKRIEAHHPDYSKPFEVIYLCTQCHHDQHFGDSSEKIRKHCTMNEAKT